MRRRSHAANCSSSTKITGVMNKVSAWLISKPPTTATPSGWRNSELAPVPSAIGVAAISAQNVVIMIGRKRRTAAS